MFELTKVITEQTTAATDLLLAIFLFMFAIRLNQFTSAKSLRLYLWIGVFLTVSISSFLGAMAHGLELSSAVSIKMWWVIYFLLDVSVATFCLAVIYDYRGVAGVKKALYALIPLAAISYILLIIYESFILFIIYQLAVMVSALLFYLVLT